MNLEKHLHIEEREGKPQTSWHPSALGSCLCGEYLKRVSTVPPKPYDQRTLRVFKMGNLIEQFFIDQLKENGVELEEQVRIEIPEWGVTGYADAVVGDEVIEVKSVHSRGFWRIIDSPGGRRKGEGAYQHHKEQLWTYLKALGKEKGQVCYISKDDLSYQQFPVFLNDEKLAKSVKDKFDWLNLALEKGIPPLPAEEGTFQAKYCMNHEVCLNQPQYVNQKGEVIVNQKEYELRKV